MQVIFKKVIFLMIALLFSAYFIFSQQVVKINIDSNHYKVGDYINVSVEIQNNTGLHGIFFDLKYDSSILEIDNIGEGILIKKVSQINELLYAHSSESASQQFGSHVIVSYTLKGNGEETTSTGSIVNMRFRVKSQGVLNQNYYFSFQNFDIIKGDGTRATGVSWLNSQNFTIDNLNPNAFIYINSPYDYQVYYENTALVSLICSNGDYKVKLTNEDNILNSSMVDVTNGSLLNQQVDLTYGLNTIKAWLYDSTGINLLATDTVKVYRSTNDKFVKIISPADHSLLNTDMVDIVVSSSYEVKVNNSNCVYYGEMDGNNKIYKVRYWLKNGFNKITATATSPENVKYTDTIYIYYQKDSSIFNFVLPKSEESFKPSSYTKLIIKGEIDSLYKTSDDPDNRSPEENTVTLKVIYTARNKLLGSKTLVDNRRAKVVESDYSYQLTRSKYMFYNDFDINLNDLDTGEIEIIAYKNKEGNKSENEIHRIIYIDNNRLWIDLVQPNVYSSDTLDSLERIKNFNEMKTGLGGNGNITVSNEGSIVLKSSDNTLNKETLSRITDAIETYNGDIYTLTNSISGSMSIFKKSFGKTNWVKILTHDGVYGYKLCNTDNGMLVGVSNLYGTEDSGVYILRENKLINLSFSEVIQHVQFIFNHNGTIYLYGSNYTYLYSFNISTCEMIDGKLNVGYLSSIKLESNLNIKQFEISSDCNTAIIRSDNDDILFYNRTASSYINVTSAITGNNDNLKGKYVLKGEYESGEYNCYLIFEGNNKITTVMENKNTGKYFKNSIDLNTNDFLKEGAVSLIGAEFKDDNFVFLYKKGNSYYTKKGQIFFTGFYSKESPKTYTNPGNYELVIENYRMMITGDNSIYFGFDTTVDRDLYAFYNKFMETGTASFNYVNEDIDGTVGFSFEIDPVWADSTDEISIGFYVKQKNTSAALDNDPVIFGKAVIPLKDTTDDAVDKPNFNISHNYDAGIGKEVITVTFNDLQINSRYINFDIDLKESGNNSPEIYNLKVFKKIMAKICKSADSIMTIPIHGYIYDRTVKEVNIQHDKIELSRDGSFYYTLKIDSSKKTIPVEIYCYNAIGERASLEFTIEVVDSVNQISNVKYKINDNYADLNLETIDTTSDKITIKGDYYGLVGASVGYEIFAYENENGVQVPKLIKRGIFDRNMIIPDISLIPQNLGTGYEGGTFIDQAIDLIPGRQRLVVYCENPGGVRSEYKVNANYPDINYSMDPNDQKIVFYNAEDETDNVVIDGIPIKSKIVDFKTYEGNTAPFVFTREYQLTGEVKSLYKFDVKFKSMTSGLTFDNGTNEIIVKTDSANRFTVNIKVVMGEDINVNKDFYISAIPTLPFLSNLKKGIKISAEKSFENTFYKPDWSAMKPENWTVQDKANYKIPIRLKFNRNDIPRPNLTRINMLVNYETEITGYLDLSSDNYYYVKDIDGAKYLDLKTDIKEGLNRIQWSIWYKELTRMSASNLKGVSWENDPDMKDFVFEYHDPDAIIPTNIAFSKDLTTEYYNESTIPRLNITKDERTWMEIRLNDNIIWKDGDDISLLSSLELATDKRKEGRNSLTISYKDIDILTKNYEFMYDSIPPEVFIETVKFSDDFKQLLELTASVKEANFDKANLYFGENIVNKKPDVIIKGSDKYELVWKDLSGDAIYPTSTNQVKIIVYDLSGKNIPSEALTGYKDLPRPDKEGIKENQINLPLYDIDNGYPILENEANYKAHDFPDHTKFVPDRFLNKDSVKQNISNFGNMLINNDQYMVREDFEDATDDGWSKQSGNWHIENGIYAASQPGISIYRGLSNYLDYSDFIYEVDIKVNGEGGILLGVDNQNYNNGYYLSLNSNDSSVKLSKLDGTVIRTVNKNIIANTNYYLKVEIEAGKINAYIDEINVFEQTVNEYRKGEVGVKDTNGIIAVDNIRLYGKLFPTKKLKPDDCLLTEDFYCKSMSISGNYAIVGSPMNYGSGDGSTGEAYIYEKDDNGNWVFKTRLLAFDGAAEDRFGWSVSISGNYVIVGASLDDSNKGAAYIYERDTSGNWVFKIKLVETEIQTGDLFGYSVSISGNYVIIGAWGDFYNAKQTGSAFIYERDSNGNWIFKTKLIAYDWAEYDNFGWSVSISGNYIIVGAYGDDDKGDASGSAYIYERDGNGNWVYKTKLVATDGAAGDKFGGSVSISGNYILVGASVDDSGKGSVYIYERDGNGNWVYKTKLVATDGAASDWFGSSVSISGNLVLIGAFDDDDKGDASGSAYIYERDGNGNWVYKTKIVATDGAAGDKFGRSVVISDNNIFITGKMDYNLYYYEKDQTDNCIYKNKIFAINFSKGENFGYSVFVSGKNAIIGSQIDDNKGYHVGSASIYEKDLSGNWKFKNHLTAYDGSQTDRFGSSVSISESYAIVGAIQDDDKGESSGSAYIYERDGSGNWVIKTKLVATDGAASDYFGYSVSISGNYAIVGSYRDDDKGTDSGSAYIYERDGNGNWVYKTKLVATDGAASDYFGQSVSISGNYIIVGAIYDDDKGANSGSAYIYERDAGGTWVYKGKITASDGAASDAFGVSVSISGNYAIIGANCDDDKGTDSGSAYIFERDAIGSWTQKSKITATDGAASDYFGGSVSISGNLVIVGSSKDDDKGVDSGSVYTYERDINGNWMQKDKITANDGATNNWFGYSVSISGNNTLVGAWGNNNNSGSAYIYNIRNNSIPINDTLLYGEGKGEYLITKVAKDPYYNVITQKEQITEGIKFRVKGEKWNKTNGQIETENPQESYIQLVYGNDKDYIVAETEYYFYHIVKISNLKEKFRGLTETMFLTGMENYTIIDKGSLYLEYNPEWKKFSPADVYITGESELFSDLVLHDSNYEAKTGNPPEYIKVNEKFNYNFENRAFTHEIVNEEPADVMTINFWLRIEEEAVKDETFEFSYKRVFTFADNTNNYQDLVHLGYKKNGSNVIIQGFDQSTGVPVSLFTVNIPEELESAWNMVTIKIDKKENLITFYIDSIAVKEIGIPVELMEKIIKQGAVYYFGYKKELEEEYKYNTGLYSIANAFYTNRLLTNDDITRNYVVYDKNTKKEQMYYFANGMSEFSDKYYDLRKIGGNDYFNANENANYTEPAGYGSLKASNEHKNYMKNKNLDTGVCTVLYYSDSYIPYNVTVNSTSNDAFTITPYSNVKGRYYFGNKNGNYGLKKDRWYSITGNVDQIDNTTTARLVLRINGKEQSIKLNKGSFHFIYDNKEMSVPEDVKVYIETDGAITLSNDIVFNEGNYSLPGETGKTAVKTFYSFNLTGTISFWYKPINANDNGFVNYSAVIFDSEFIKISTKIKEGMEDAVFVCELKKDEEGNTTVLETDTKVSYGWQYIQVSYDCNYNICYMYINGKLVNGYEDTITRFGSLIGDVNKVDNVFIGSNKEQTQFAEGYIDEVVLSNFYKKSSYIERTPVDVAFDNNTLQVATEQIVELTNPSINGDYKISSIDGNYYKENTLSSLDNTIDLSANYPPSRYRLTTAFKINEHNYSNILSFNLDNVPRFVLKENTPIIFKNVPASVGLKFGYDRSYKFSSQVLKYAGNAVRVYNESGLNKIIYLVQDFINQNTNSWLIGEEEAGGNINWMPIASDNAGMLTVLFKNISSDKDLKYEYRTFYFSNNFSVDYKFNNLMVQNNIGNIPIASIDYSIVDKLNQNEYKIVVKVGETSGNSAMNSEIFNRMIIEHTVKKENTTNTYTASANLGSDGVAEIYYDDILPDYGVFDCHLKLKYNGVAYYEVDTEKLNWENKTITIQPIEEKKLEIEEFSLLYIDKETDKANFYLKFDANGISGDIENRIEVIYNNKKIEYSNDPLFSGDTDKTMIYENIPIPKGECIVKIVLISNGTISSDMLMRTAEIEINNSVNAPEIALTNSVDSLIAYNNVYFSWKGYYSGEYNTEIEYSYNFDNKGWSAPNREWRSVRYYNLEEGYHSFGVKAIYKGIESSVRSVIFFVDINKPVFDSTKIEVQKLYDAQNVFYAVNIIGNNGAIIDSSLQKIIVDGKEINRGEEGSFAANDILIKKDGSNEILITAYDKVGNFTDYVVEVPNYITEIIYPDNRKSVKYSPMSIVGRINKEIPNGMKIYVKDPLSLDKGKDDYSGWKPAKINEDRTFFVEDVFVNPGSSVKEIVTTLKLVCVFNSGKVFERDINVWANEIIMPIEMKLSNHAAEGENADTYVEIDCKANVDNISSWSIDYNGDGVYDDIRLVKNPLISEAKIYKWEHKYSSLGLVKPRVRVITTNGNFFSVSDTLIIHEKIKEASNKMIDKPVSLSAVSLPDNSKLIFVLRGDVAQDVEVYEIGRNDTYISNKKETIDINALGIRNAVKIKAYDRDHLFIAANYENKGYIFELVVNDFGNYIVNENTTVVLNGKIRDISCDKNMLYISDVNNNYLVRIPIKDKLLEVENQEIITPEVKDSYGIRENSGIAKDNYNLYVADYLNNRIIRLSNNMIVLDQFGSIGTGEGEFIKPAIIKSYENRIFVFDESRRDIQVFDYNFKPVCTLKYSTEEGYDNYLESEFFYEITDIDIIAKEEGNKLYYYALLMSKTTNKLAMLRLPQWEELRAKVRNNKIVFLKDGEVFTAKPDGGDITKILSSDSIPRIEGTLDYPALSPDGRSLAFISRMKLYNGGEGGGSEYAYDNMYLIDIETKNLIKINLGAINGYEIERPVFNSNGDKLIFSAKKTGSKWQIYFYNIKTGITEKLFNSEENARFPYYSPDDRFVVYTTDYDGDEDIEIIDTKNTAMRVIVTSNSTRDSLPVWSRIYPFEILNQELKIETKIAFVSERNFHKGIYYVYLARKSDSDIRVVTSDGAEIGNKPDTAVIEITNNTTEGDYPCYTGDGKNVVFEYYDGTKLTLKKYNFEDKTIYQVNLPGEIRRPAGMKNMIANFTAVNKNGDEIELNWDRYTSNDIYYNVQFQLVSKPNEPFVDKKIFSQNGTLLKGLEMGQEYLLRVCIFENEEEVASSQWQKVTTLKVIARPTFEIDKNNPYLVKLHAWKPKPETTWFFNWIIDNTEINANSSQDFMYEFGTSGTKTIFLKAYDSLQGYVNISSPIEVDIISDIEPVIEYMLAEDSSYIELSALSTKGKKIDLSSALWTISGPGRDIPIQTTGSKVIVQLNNFSHKINVNLSLKRIPVNGQMATDTIQKNLPIDLDLKEVKPVITYEADITNSRLIKFSGEQSKGNIDWYRARWTVYSNETVLKTEDGVSTFAHLFPESNNDTTYTVTLTVPRRNDGMTETVSLIVGVDASPIEPEISYEILTLKEGQNVIGAKVLFDCTKSKGSGIDFTQARWSVPVAGQYSEQPTQFGPTAIYNLMGLNPVNGIVVEVNLVLTRRGGTDVKSITKLVNIRINEIQDSKLIVTKNIEEATNGKIVILDVLKSTGPNIDWEKTEWLIDNQYSRKGSAVRVDVPATETKTKVNYVCTLYRNGMTPQIEKGYVNIQGAYIVPIITPKRLSATQKNCYELDVLDTQGVNIDWEKTQWYIYDGNENVIQKTGAKISHAFVLKSEQMGYPVMVQMFLKGSSYPFTRNITIDIEGDELKPVIMYDAYPDDPNTIIFRADTSLGSNVDWNKTKWTFGDSTQPEYGPIITHHFQADSKNKRYTVTLTLTRTSMLNGKDEIAILTKEINIAKDEIKAVIKAEIKGDYVILSAEESIGKGLLLDRSVWTFTGKMNSESFTQNSENGVILRNSAADNTKTSFSTGFDFGMGVQTAQTTMSVGPFSMTTMAPQFYLSAIASLHTGIARDTNFGFSYEMVDSSDYKNFQETFANSDSHVGAICRRLIVDKEGKKLSKIYVTLFVYRINIDGGMQGESVTVEINPGKLSGIKIIGN